MTCKQLLRGEEKSRGLPVSVDDVLRTTQCELHSVDEGGGKLGDLLLLPLRQKKITVLTRYRPIVFGINLKL